MKIRFYIALAAYSLLLLLLQPLLALYLLNRARKQPDYLQGWAQRFLAWVPSGYRQVPVVSRVWVHAVSVGETHAISPLVHAWAKKHPDHVWYFTSTTPTGQATAKQLFCHLNGVQFAWLPYDLPWLAWRCLIRIRPSRLWLVETEIWPNLILAAHGKKVQVALLNARVSPTTARRLRQFEVLSRSVLAGIDQLICQTDEDAKVFEQLGRPVDGVCGNLKFDVILKPDLVETGWQWKNAIGTSPVLLFASSREGEEALLLEALVRSKVFECMPHVCVWIVPRHPQRFNEVFDLMKNAAIQACVPMPVRRSEFDLGLNSLRAAPRLVLGDSMGEMPAYYSAADVAVLGGSWLPLGGQNLIEACAYGCPVWMGPYTFNFAKAAEDALKAGAAVRFDNLTHVCNTLMQTPVFPEQFKGNALAYAKSHVGAAQATIHILERN